MPKFLYTKNVKKDLENNLSNYSDKFHDQFFQRCETISKYSFQYLQKSKTIRKIKGRNKYKIQELKVDVGNMAGRFLFAPHNKKHYLLTFFFKKSDKIPPREIERARKIINKIKNDF